MIVDNFYARNFFGFTFVILLGTDDVVAHRIRLTIITRVKQRFEGEIVVFYGHRLAIGKRYTRLQMIRIFQAVFRYVDFFRQTVRIGTVGSYFDKGVKKHIADVSVISGFSKQRVEHPFGIGHPHNQGIHTIDCRRRI
ncbi:hypothetical protein D1872_224460 [compost metagenome]